MSTFTFGVCNIAMSYCRYISYDFAVYDLWCKSKVHDFNARLCHCVCVCGGSKCVYSHLVNGLLSLCIALCVYHRCGLRAICVYIFIAFESYCSIFISLSRCVYFTEWFIECLFICLFVGLIVCFTFRFVSFCLFILWLGFTLHRVPLTNQQY